MMKPHSRLTGVIAAAILLPLFVGCSPMPRSTAHQPARHNWAAAYDGKNPVTKKMLNRANDPSEKMRQDWDREQRDEWEREVFDPFDLIYAGKQVIENLDEEPYLYSDPGFKGSEL